jgi:hypothetical protein
MAVVYEAEQASLGRRVAVKVLSRASLTPQQVQRVHREARSSAKLHHTPALRHQSNLWHAAFSPDGRRAVTTGLTAQVWELPMEERPVADLVRLARVLTGLAMRKPGQFVPLEIAQFRADWAALASRYPRDFRAYPSAAETTPDPSREAAPLH